MTGQNAPTRETDALRLQRALAPVRGTLRRASGLSVLAALLWPLQAAIVAALFAGLLTGAPLISPGAAALSFLALAGLRTALSFVAEARLFDAAQTVQATERLSILHREARGAASSAYGGPGAVAALATEKLDALHPYLTRYAPARARVMVLPPVILALSGWHSWAVGIVLLAAGPLIPVFMALVGWAAQAASERQMAQVGALGDLLVDRLAALPDIRILDAGRQVVAGYSEATEDLRARTMAVLRVAFLSSTVLELFAALGVAMVAVWVGFSLLDLIGWGAWGGTITPFAGIFLLLLAPDYFQPLRDLAGAWHDKAAALAVAGDLTAWEAEMPPAILGTGGDAAPLPGPATVALSGLAARRGSRLIRYPDLNVAPGERIAIAGPSGVGKTTLLRLIAGLEAPEAGRLDVCGRPLDTETADAWRARLGWMPQHPAFLTGSLRHNIAFGAPLPEDAIRDAALAPVIAALPRGADTQLGETGAGLSGGEARRVMLARALAARPDVLLADEPTADLDADTAARVTDGLMRLAESGATLIVATHDPRLIARMDRTVTLEAAS